MKNKIKYILAIVLFTMSIFLYKYNKYKFLEKKDNVQTNILVSNLKDEETLKKLKEDFLSFGIQKEKVELLIEDIIDFNKSGAEIHNCRLTSFRVLEDYIEISNPKIGDDLMLFADKEAIEENPSLVGEKENEFLSIFSYIPTKNTTEVTEHIKIFKDSLKERNVKFNNNNISLISVIFYTNIEGEDDTALLFIGHAGLLWEKNGKYNFFEKISYYEPYQLTVFNDKQELNDYLMGKYDVDTTGQSSIPFIFENDSLLKEFRPNLNKN